MRHKAEGGVAPPRILIVAGSDPSGGAGIQADIKTVTALGGYAAAAITALTAQNSLGVFDVLPVPADFVAAQMRLTLSDIGADAVKTGMLQDAAIVAAVAATLAEYAPSVPLIVDPVLVSSSGRTLLDEAGIAALRRLLLPRTCLLTPNLPEAELLLGRAIGSPGAMERAAVDLCALGPHAVLLKGGHGSGGRLTDILAGPEGIVRFTSRKIETRHTHGTGCTLASAAATYIAFGLTLPEAIARARRYLRAALRAAPGFGAGQGPMNHAVGFRSPRR